MTENPGHGAVRDGIARILFDRDQIALERRGYFKMRWEESDDEYLKPWREEAQAIVDEFGLTLEERFAYATDLQLDGMPLSDGLAMRVVGNWWRL